MTRITIIILLITSITLSGCIQITDYQKEEQIQTNVMQKEIQEKFWSERILSNETIDLSRFIDYAYIVNNGTKYEAYPWGIAEFKLFSKKGNIYLRIIFHYGRIPEWGSYNNALESSGHYILDSIELKIKDDSPRALKISIPTVVRDSHIDIYGGSILYKIEDTPDWGLKLWITNESVFKR